MQLHLSLGVGRNACLHPMEKAEIICVLGHAGKELADRKAAFAMAIELPRAGEKFCVAAIGLAITFRELWLVVKSIHVGRGAGHV